MLIRSTVTILLFIITELLASVTGDLRLIVKTFNTGSSTILLTELVSPGILRAEESKSECAALRKCTTEPVALKINHGKNENQCYYDESENTSCSYRFRLSGSTGDLTTFYINRQFDSRLMYLLLICNNQHNISFWNPQENPSLMTFNELVTIIWSIEQDSRTYFRVENAQVGTVLYAKTAFISPWTYQIFCNSLPSSSLLPTTMTPTVKPKTSTTPISPTTVPTQIVPTRTEVPTRIVPTRTEVPPPTVPPWTVPPRTVPTWKGLTTRISYISNTYSSTSTPTSPIKGDMTNKNNVLDGTTQGQGKKEGSNKSAELTIYILSSFVGLFAVVVIVGVIYITRLKRNQKSRHSNQTKSAAELGQPTVVTQEEPVGAYESLKMDNYENVGTYEQIQTQQASCYEEILPAE